MGSGAPGNRPRLPHRPDRRVRRTVLLGDRGRSDRDRRRPSGIRHGVLPLRASAVRLARLAASAPGKQRAAPAALLAAGLISLAAAAVVASLLGQAFGRQGWEGLFVAANPGLLYSAAARSDGAALGRAPARRPAALSPWPPARRRGVLRLPCALEGAVRARSRWRSPRWELSARADDARHAASYRFADRARCVLVDLREGAARRVVHVRQHRPCVPARRAGSERCSTRESAHIRPTGR